MLIALHKPYGVLSQFTPEPGSRWKTLADFSLPKSVYPLGRLDADSEGLLLLSDEARFNERLLHPKQAHERTYHAQVERIPTADELKQLEVGVVIEARRTLPCRVGILDPQPSYADREPPIRVRKNVPDVWIELKLVEGKNRQVRKMTASIGHPTLRLIRVAVGSLTLGGLKPGEWRSLKQDEIDALLGEVC